jgi:ATP-dependent DNA ligase
MKRFGDLSNSIAKELKVRDAILDGEIVSLIAPAGLAFYDLMKRQCDRGFYVFDIVWLNERDCGSCR